MLFSFAFYQFDRLSRKTETPDAVTEKGKQKKRIKFTPQRKG